jgi:hypothetical protein
MNPENATATKTAGKPNIFSRAAATALEFRQFTH